MATRVYIPVRLTQASATALALLVGLLAGIKPAYALAAAGGGVFVALVLRDLALGVALFTAVSFLEVIPNLAGGFSAAKFVGLLLALSWLAMVAMRQHDRAFSVTHPGAAGLIVGLAAWVVLSVIWAEQTSGWLTATGSWILNLALFPIVFAALREPRHVVWLFVGFIGGALVSAAFGVVNGPAANVGDRLGGGGLNPNQLGAVLTVGAILAASLGSRRGWAPPARMIAFLAGILCVLALLATVSRGAILGFAVALAAAPFVVGPRRRFAAFSLAALVAAGAFMYFALIAPASDLHRFTTPDRTGNGRTDIWTVGWRMVQAHPVNGIGAGNFQVSSIHYLLRPGVIQHPEFIIDKPKVAHNVYLQVLAELGVVGELIFLALIAFCVRCAALAAQRFAALRDTSSELLARGLLLGLIALLSSEFFSSELFSKQLWLLLAAAPAMLAIAQRRAKIELEGLSA